MARGIRRSKEEKLNDDIKKIEVKLEDLQAKKEKVLAPLIEKEEELKAEKKALEEELDKYKKEVIVSTLDDGDVSVDQVADLVNAISTKGLSVEDVLAMINSSASDVEEAAVTEE